MGPILIAWAKNAIASLFIFQLISQATVLPILAKSPVSPSYSMYFPNSHKLPGGLLSPQSQCCFWESYWGTRSVHQRSLVFSYFCFYSCHATSLFPPGVSIHYAKVPLLVQIPTQTRAMRDDKSPGSHHMFWPFSQSRTLRGWLIRKEGLPASTTAARSQPLLFPNLHLGHQSWLSFLE